eukprot:COSAG01_NODE_17047_length_1182_cov_3.625115_2_plen_134_part_00
MCLTTFEDIDASNYVECDTPPHAIPCPCPRSPCLLLPHRYRHGRSVIRGAGAQVPVRTERGMEAVQVRAGDGGDADAHAVRQLLQGRAEERLCRRDAPVRGAQTQNAREVGERRQARGGWSVAAGALTAWGGG